MSQLTRLRQATANPELLTTKKVTSSKLERMVEIVDEAVENGDKVIIFSNYSKNINAAITTDIAIGYKLFHQDVN